LAGNFKNHRDFQPYGVSRRLQVQSAHGEDPQWVERLLRRGLAHGEALPESSFPIIAGVLSVPGGAVAAVPFTLAGGTAAHSLAIALPGIGKEPLPTDPARMLARTLARHATLPSIGG
jgi:hypothetical protein